MAGRPRMPEKDRFLSHVNASENGCWEWSAFKMKNGYGLFRQKNRHALAHRESFRLFKGDLVEGLDVMHSCDSRSCVNPSHLSLGTRKENMQDAINKGRFVEGETHPSSKLTATQVNEIRAESKMLQKELAEKYGVSQQQICRIKQGLRWTRLESEV